MIVTVENEMPRDNDKQLGSILIAISNDSWLSWMTSSIMSILNDEDAAPAEIVTLNTEAVTL